MTPRYPLERGRRRNLRAFLPPPPPFSLDKSHSIETQSAYISGIHHVALSEAPKKLHPTSCGVTLQDDIQVSGGA